MEAGVHGFGKGDLARHHLSDALSIAQSTKSHEVKSATAQSGGGSEKLSSDSYTNAQGITVTSRPNAQAIVTTRDDLIHEHFARSAKSTTVRSGNVTQTHAEVASALDKTDHATVNRGSGTTTIDAHVTVNAQSTSDSTAVKNGDTTHVTGDSDSHVERDAHVTVTNAAGTATADSSRTVDASTVSAATVTAKNGTTTVDAQAATEFSVKADGTIVDAHGKVIQTHETGHGVTVTDADASSKTTSSTVRTADGGVTTSDTASKSERDAFTSYEGVLSSTTAGGKTTTRYIEYTVEDDTQTTAHTHTVDDFTVHSTAATQKSGKPGGTVTQTVDTSSDSQSQIVSQRTDAVHATGKPEGDGDGTTVRATDTVDAESVRATQFQSSAHIVTDNGAVVTTTDRRVSGETVAASETDAKINTVTTTDHDAGSTSQTIRRTSESESDVVSLTSYDAQTNSSSSNGATSTRTDRVTSATEYDVKRSVRYVAFIRTVVTPAAAASTFAASA